MDNNWCYEHNHTKKSCPWCEIAGLEQQLESVQRERDEYRREVQSLQRDKSALIEVLEWYGEKSNYEEYGTFSDKGIIPGYVWSGPDVTSDKGKRARTILSKMK